MTEAMWVELIRVLPTFVWLGFAVAALVVVRRIFAPQAHRIAKVETPFVSVELAQEAIEEAKRADRAPTEPLAPRPRRVPAAGLPPRWDPPPTAPPPDDVEPQEPRPTTEPDFAPAAVPADAPAEDERAPTAPPLPRQDGPASEAPMPPYPVSPPLGFETDQRLPLYASRSVPGLRPSAMEADRSLRAATRLARAAELLQFGRILWVDDRPAGNRSLVRLFRTAGVAVEEAETTEQAMELMREGRRFDLVISDMTRDNEPAGASAGVELLDRMVREGVPTPAVVYTTAREASATSHPRAVGATGNPEELVHLVVDVLTDRIRRRIDGFDRRLPWKAR